MNKGSFKERMTSYVQELVNPMSYYDWINQNTTIQGIPFTCDRYPFQKAIINDMSQELHCIKPSQIGLPLSLKTPVFTTEGMKSLGTSTRLKVKKPRWFIYHLFKQIHLVMN